jgi:60 kDa SS-A/Ro ribonucleoprotein
MNKRLFANRSEVQPITDTVNQAGGAAYAMDSEWALAQLAFTGTFTSTFYDTSGGENQLTQLLEHAGKVSPDYHARLAVAAREVGYMKDMPTALVAALASRDLSLFKTAFNKVIDAPNMLKTAFQMFRSGRFGHKGLGYSVKKTFERKIRSASPSWLYNLSIGSNPSIKDIFKLLHIKPRTREERATWGYLLGQRTNRWGEGVDMSSLPKILLVLDRYNKSSSEQDQLDMLDDLKGIRWEALTGNVRGPRVWKGFVNNMRAQALRMNLNTLQRHGAFKDQEIVSLVANRLADIDDVRGSIQFPFQYLAAYLHLDGDVQAEVRSGLHKAAEAACGNIPRFGCPVAILVDVSRSMSNTPVTGIHGPGKTSKIRCIDAAVFFAVALWRTNPGSVLIPFDTDVYTEALSLDHNDSLLSLTTRLAMYGGGGTDCSCSLRYINDVMADKPFGVAVLISDNESWADHMGRYSGQTGTMVEFGRFVVNQRHLGKYRSPKLVCLDLAPGATCQIPNTDNTLPVGGFSDGVFSLLGQFISGDKLRFVDMVKQIQLD